MSCAGRPGEGDDPLLSPSVGERTLDDMTTPQTPTIESSPSPQQRSSWLRETLGSRPGESATWGVPIGLVLGLPSLYPWFVFGYLFVDVTLDQAVDLLNGRPSDPPDPALVGQVPYAFASIVVLCVTGVLAALAVARWRPVSWPTVLFFEFLASTIPFLLVHAYFLSDAAGG